MANYAMADHEQIPVGFAVKSKGGVLFTELSELPAGSTATFESSDTAIVGVTIRPSGLAAEWESNAKGTATLTSTLHIPAGPDMPAIDVQSVDTVVVSISAPGTAEFGVGAPEPEN